MIRAYYNKKFLQDYLQEPLAIEAMGEEKSDKAYGEK